MRHSLLKVGGLAIVALLAVDGGASARTNNALSCGAMPVLMDRYSQLHISGKKRDAAFVEQVAKTFLDRYDPSKSMLTAEQAERLKGQVREFFKDVDKGTCSSVAVIRAEQLAYQQGMEVFVKKTLGDPKYKLDKAIRLEMDPDKRARAKSPAELDGLRTKLVAFQVANLVHGGTTIDEAKQKVMKRYELATRRVKELEEADIYTMLLDAYADAFDPHTSYFSAEDLEDFRISMQLSLEGIGAVLRSQDGFTTIAEIVHGGAADREGTLRPEDKITAVAQGDDGEPVDTIDMSLRDVVRMIRGKKGTKVRLTVLRGGAKTQTFNVTIVRDKIDLEEQAAKLRWENVERDGKQLKLAILDLPSFYGSSDEGGRDCAQDVAKLLNEARNGGADGIVLDLSANSGGLLQAAVEIGGLFIKTGGIVRVEGEGGRNQTLEDTDDRIQWSGPLVVLTSRLSASASEIVAGAIKDYHRGVIVGDDQTYGKGSVQNVVNLPEGLGAMKVTTALFFRPSGESTQLDGVAADIVVPSPFNLPKFGERSNDNALPHRRTINFTADQATSNTATGWTPLTDGVVKQLAAASVKRQKASPEFKKVAETLAKAEKKDTSLSVGEILDGKGDEGDEDAAKKDEKKDEAKEKEKLSPEALEALQILADLVTVDGGAYGARVPK